MHGRGVTPAPLPLPEGARFDEHTFANEAGGRTYKLYVPSSYVGQGAAIVSHAARLYAIAR